MIKDLELTFSTKFYQAQNLLHNETKKYNNLLKKQNPNYCLYSGLVDAVKLDVVEKLCTSHDKVFLITDHFIDNLPKNAILTRLPAEWYGCYYVDQIPLDQPIVKDFNCFLNRIDPIRQTWFYLLFARKLLDSGHVSFNMNVKPLPALAKFTGFDLFDSYHRDYLSSFDSIKEQIRAIVPFKNFVDHNDLFSVTLSSKISIIPEIYVERTDAKILTEKTFRALQLPRPWLLFAATGSVDKIRSLGFDVYDDIVDHSYDHFDTSLNSVQRQESILDQLPQITKLEFTPALTKRLEQGAQHNRLLLANWSIKWQELCIDQIRNIFLEALEN